MSEPEPLHSLPKVKTEEVDLTRSWIFPNYMMSEPGLSRSTDKTEHVDQIRIPQNMRPSGSECDFPDQRFHLEDRHVTKSHQIPSGTGQIEKAFNLRNTLLTNSGRNNSKTQLEDHTIEKRAYAFAQKTFEPRGDLISLKEYLSNHSAKRSLQCNLCEKIFRYPGNRKDISIGTVSIDRFSVNCVNNPLNLNLS
eukprot:198533_1